MCDLPSRVNLFREQKPRLGGELTYSGAVSRKSASACPCACVCANVCAAGGGGLEAVSDCGG